MAEVPPAERWSGEWLEADGLGGFASGTVAGARTPSLSRPAAGRDAAADRTHGAGQRPRGLARDRRRPLRAEHAALHAGRDLPGRRIGGSSAFAPIPGRAGPFGPTDGTELTQEIVARHGHAEVALRWRLGGAGRRQAERAPAAFRPRLPRPAPREPGLRLRRPRSAASEITWRPYHGRAGDLAAQQRPLPAPADLVSRLPLRRRSASAASTTSRTWRRPACFSWELGRARRRAGAARRRTRRRPSASREGCARAIFAAETTRRAGASARPLQRAADAYVVRRGDGKTIIAGYPWFTDWGRDTFIALRGLLTLPGGLDARARHPAAPGPPTVSRGHAAEPLPRRRRAARVQLGRRLALVRRRGARVPERGARRPAPMPTVQLLHARDRRDPRRLSRRHALRHPHGRRRPARRRRARRAAHLDGRQGRRLGRDAAHRQAGRGPGAVVQRAAHRRPRGSRPSWPALADRGAGVASARASGTTRGCLFDVVDVDHVRGRNDPTLRPNQIFAVGGLPLRAARAASSAGRVVATVEKRAADAARACARLAPDEPGYRGRYEGGVRERDGAYHQGTVWPWLIGPFVEAWLRVRGVAPAAQARGRPALPRAAARASRARRARPRLRDRRRRAAAHAARLPVPGLVARRAAAA